jgi:glyoxylase-like metal-dependent hydrolase (beta-lactamase superfamily II)
MMRRLSWFLTLVVVSSGCAAATPEQQMMNDVAAALGGRDRLLAVRTLVAEGQGTQYNLGQDMRPKANGQTFTLSPWRRATDVTSSRSRTELTRTPNFAYFQGPQSQRQVQGVDGEVAYNVGANGSATRVGGQAALDRRADFYHHPATLVRAALAPGAVVSNVRADGAGRAVDIRTDSGLQFVLAVDGANLPVRVESRTYHPNLGDVVITTRFAEYQDVDGLKLPARLTAAVDDFTVTEVRVSKQTTGGDAGDLAAPAAAASAQAPAGAPAPNVVPEEVARGLWLLGGQSHHSVLVEFSDHLLLIDAPQSEARAVAVIAKARELRPQKPLTQLVTTHHHFDHTAGIRAAIAEGLTVITHSGNRQLFEELANRPHTIAPDALARKPQPLKIETVDDERTLKDSAMTLALYHVAGNPHSDTMLMAYVPSARVLVQVDAFSPGSAVNPYAENLLSNVTRRGLSVDRIVPLHGTIAPLAELAKAVRAGTN